MEAMRRRLVPKALFDNLDPMTRIAAPSKFFQTGGVVTAQPTRPTQEAQLPIINIQNVINPNLVDSQLQKPSGQKAVLNVISENVAEIKRILR